MSVSELKLSDGRSFPSGSILYLENGCGNCATFVPASGLVVTGEIKPEGDRLWEVEVDAAKPSRIAFRNLHNGDAGRPQYLNSRGERWGTPYTVQSATKQWFRAEPGTEAGSYMLWNEATTGYLQNWDSAKYVNSVIRTQQNAPQQGRGFEYHKKAGSWFLSPTPRFEEAERKRKAKEEEKAKAEEEAKAKAKEEEDAKAKVEEAPKDGGGGEAKDVPAVEEEEKAEPVRSTELAPAVNGSAKHDESDHVCEKCGKTHSCAELQEREAAVSAEKKNLVKREKELEKLRKDNEKKEGDLEAQKAKVRSKLADAEAKRAAAEGVLKEAEQKLAAVDAERAPLEKEKAELGRRQAELAKKEDALGKIDADTRAREKDVTARESAVAKREAAANAKEQRLAQKDANLDHQQDAVAKREADAADREKLLKAREAAPGPGKAGQPADVAKLQAALAEARAKAAVNEALAKKLQAQMLKQEREKRAGTKAAEKPPASSPAITPPANGAAKPGIPSRPAANVGPKVPAQSQATHNANGEKGAAKPLPSKPAVNGTMSHSPSTTQPAKQYTPAPKPAPNGTVSSPTSASGAKHHTLASKPTPNGTASTPSSINGGKQHSPASRPTLNGTGAGHAGKAPPPATPHGAVDHARECPTCHCKVVNSEAFTNGPPKPLNRKIKAYVYDD